MYLKKIYIGFQRWGFRLDGISRRTKMLWEIFFALTLFLGSVLVRIYWYQHHITEVYGTMEYCEMAVKKGGNEVPRILHGISYLYTEILTWLFAFLGNKLSAGIILQVILQSAGILFVFLGVRNLLGRMEAVVSLALLSFLPVMIVSVFTLTPENLYFFLFAGMWFLISCYKKWNDSAEKSIVGKYSRLLLSGVGIGYMIYLDIAGVLLLITLLSILSESRGSVKEKISSTVFLLIVSFACVGLLLWFWSFFNKTSLIQTIRCFKELYFPLSVWNYEIAAPDITTAGNILVFSGVLWYLFGVFVKRKNKGGFVVISLLLLLLSVFLGIPYIDYQILGTLYWSVLAAAGAAVVLEMGRLMMPAEEWKIPTEPEKMEEMKKERLSGINMEDRDIEEPEKKKIVLIENPLPLPKKHVKKTMDYRFEPEPELMKFDIEIKENDDFDLQ